MTKGRIAAVEQYGDHFIAYLPEQPLVRGKGATQEEALQQLAFLLQTRAGRMHPAPPVQTIVVRSNHRSPRLR